MAKSHLYSILSHPKHVHAKLIYIISYPPRLLPPKTLLPYGNITFIFYLITPKTRSCKIGFILYHAPKIVHSFGVGYIHSTIWQNHIYILYYPTQNTFMQNRIYIISYPKNRS